jgi:hypothetical protein
VICFNPMFGEELNGIVIPGARVLGIALLALTWGFIAVIGMPVTPMSYAGVARP